MPFINECKDLSYNLCGKCIYWEGGKCIITGEETTASTPCSDNENFSLRPPKPIIFR